MNMQIVRAMLAFTLVAAAPPGSVQTARTPAPAAVTRPGLDITGPKIRVANLDRSIKFYTEGLGLTLTRRIGAKIAVVAATGKTPPPLILLIEDPKPITVGDGLYAIMLSSDDPVGFRARLKAAGYATADEGNSGSFLVKDPDGYTIEITPSQPAPSAARP